MNANVTPLKVEPTASMRSPENKMPNRDASMKVVKLVVRDQHDPHPLGAILKNAAPKVKLRISFNILSIMVALFLIWLLYLVR